MRGALSRGSATADAWPDNEIIWGAYVEGI